METRPLLVWGDTGTITLGRNLPRAVEVEEKLFSCSQGHYPLEALPLRVGTLETYSQGCSL